ncbi:glucose/mannose transport system substrate-binding protein [Andreprevotia lacus DSM 23236]|jgi:glucose/mannose transport system substrate-binding protein|uniref:Probable sugar-binding periplasmic protein n=1 Tax=Andreprevotia lacus DSM 23236 TaxID=1121001 RepID=A0A1W1X2C4_9NEIS|nr:ABC transporter substrate-binding protein [Andreprevotia lacus]SMC18092.1 glucose/mannose transport system substrate-binding protein [Andreprevotia lacus DSM 23236]
MKPSLSRYLVAPLALAVLASSTLAHAQQKLDVLHWWTSQSERKAADALADALDRDDIQWRDAAIAGGAGIGAMKVLKSRLLSGRAPDVAQLIGPAIQEWAELGLLLELDNVSTQNGWSRAFFPTIWTLVRQRGHVVAVPVGIHRINTLFYQKRIFAELGLTPPRNWAEFERVADKLKRAGVIPLAQSSEPWQVATLFETLVLSESSPSFYRQLFTRGNEKLWFDPRVTRALERLRRLKQWMPDPIAERHWEGVARQLASGEVGMWVMGDWAKGELQTMGLTVDEQFGCMPVPGTADYHLYSVDTFVMLADDYGSQVQQEKLAQLAASPAVQARYNQIKGSVPVRRDADVNQMDSCARASWRTFNRGALVQAPSMTHRMASDEGLKDAIIAQLHRYFADEHIPASETQRRIAALARALGNRKSED